MSDRTHIAVEAAQVRMSTAYYSSTQPILDTQGASDPHVWREVHGNFRGRVAQRVYDMLRFAAAEQSFPGSRSFHRSS